ncbi:MAG: homocysteine S-methyltransferase family protein [Firmicutes bacterium]|nr:homocysteine S-methyltransferase family protein [Bacillota bacterium]
MGTMMQANGLEPGEVPELMSITHPEVIRSIHRSYVEAGSDIIYANTFGANTHKVPEDCGHTLEEIIEASVKTAKAAGNADTKVALDVGPLGELLEPMGSLKFEEAYDAFRRTMIQGEKSGADLIVIETMTDLYEVKAAVLAAKENTDLPVMVSMSFEESGRTFTGTDVVSMAVTLEGLGVDAIGINCSLGPAEIYPIAEKMCASTDLPVFVKPNAGLPDPRTNEYDIDAEQFAEMMTAYLDLGIAAAGGCCGTTPEYIAAVKKAFAGKERSGRRPAEKKSIVCSAVKPVTIDHVAVIGERINPTGKKRLKQALLDEDYDYILSQAVEQIDAGAEILDVNVGVPKLDDVAMLPKVVKQLQAITDLPLQIDSSNPAAIEAALRVYNGKPIVNSVNGEDKVMEAILPLVKKYGAAVIGLTLDENGIPATAEERFAIAQRIMDCALGYGIAKEDIYIDCLTLTASAQQAEVAETLKAVRMVKEQLGLHTALGVSNISFGLPCRPLVNRTFLAMAMENGLDLPIINPNDEDMMGTVYAFEMLHNRDKNAEKFIERYSEASIGTMSRGASVKETAESAGDLYHALEKGMKAETLAAVKELLKTEDAMTIVNNHLIPALDRVGQGFEKGTIFLPQMMQAATAAQGGFELIKDHLAQSGQEKVSKGTVVLATVKGDIHDIGKNIVKVIMENYGFDIIDLGRDVAPETVVETVKAKDIKLVGLSALMTTTLGSMEETIAAVKAADPECKVMVGGAVLTADFAERIGADFYCKDAMKSVEAANSVFE